MKSRVAKSFWDRYNALPPQIQLLATKQHRLWLTNPRHPSLHFKKVGPYWSARVNDNYRAVRVLDADTVIWFFVGTHAEYQELLQKR